MKISRLLLVACLLVETVGLNRLLAQIPGIPKFHGLGRHKDDPRARRQSQDGNEGSQSAPPGVPVSADNPMFTAFRNLEQQKVYHQRMAITTSDPQMAQVMAQMGFAPTETITAGDLKQVSMHFQMPVHGHMEDFELRTVLRDGRIAKKWSSPASGRILKEQDANLAKQLAQAEAQSAKSIAQNLAGGPWGWASAAVSAAGAAASIAEAAKLRKQAHDFFEWTCMDGGPRPSQGRKEPPPLTDLREKGDQTLDGMAVTGYEFYVRQDGKFHGPIQMYISKDNGLPARMLMSDARSGGSMQMDYFGFNQGGDIEVPACLGEK